jgi:hypothetical protein
MHAVEKPDADAKAVPIGAGFGWLVDDVHGS